jgi:hypothetical protein
MNKYGKIDSIKDKIIASIIKPAGSTKRKSGFTNHTWLQILYKL